jgi:hypothetical protein
MTQAGGSAPRPLSDGAPPLTAVLVIEEEPDPELEQRRTKRHPFIAFAWYKRVDDRAASDEEGVARSCDVSDGGIGMVTTRPFPLNAYLFIELIAGESRISALGRVMHSSALTSGHFRVGVRVESVPPTCQLAWQQLLAEERPDG